MDPVRSRMALRLNQEKLKILETLTCKKCQHFLNIPPLMSFKDGTTMCGRCYDPSEYENCDRPTRNTPFESIVQLFPFPCFNREKGCPQRNVTKNYLKHENSCCYRKIECPIQDCIFQGIIIEIKEHFQQEHADNYRQNSNIKMETNCFVIDDGKQEILCQTKFIDGKYYCDCINLLPVGNIMELEFKSPKNSIIFKQNISNLFDENKALQINVTSLKQLLNTDEVMVAEIKLIDSDEDKYKQSDKKLLNELKCPVCLHLFMPPVFLCSNGHSICASCQNQLTTCPMCRVVYENPVHNFSLEKLIGEMIYPCKYNICGCVFSAPSAHIQQHEASCEYML